MTSIRRGRRGRCERRGRVAFGFACALVAALAVAFPAASAHADAPEADALIAGLARAPPTSVAFAEARFSTLLLAPIVVSGELRYPGPASLERIVTVPYRERTSIRGDSVTVTRDGERDRTFALRRSPELRGLLMGLVALLAGDAAAVQRNFDVAVGGSADGWRLELTPRDGTVRRRLAGFVATGAGAELGCFAIRNAEGGTTVMLLGASAADGIGADATLASLLARCRAE
jgi:hypothetical protein